MSNKTINKVTPLHDSTWYVKWVSSILLLIAVACRSVEEIPKIYDVAIGWIGTMGWLWVGYKWHDRALILLNSVIVFMLTLSLLRYFVL